MTVLVTNLFPRPDAPTRGMYNWHTATALARLTDVRVVCLVPSRSPCRRAVAGGWSPPAPCDFDVCYEPYWSVPLIGRDHAWRFAARALTRRRRELGEADAIIGSWLYPDAVACAVLGRRLGVPVWWMALGTDRAHLDAPVRGRRIRREVKSVRGVICVSDSLRSELVERGIEPSKVRVVWNGVDVERFKPMPRAEARQALSGVAPHLPWAQDANVRCVLFVGNLVPVKRPDWLIEVFARVRAQGARDARLVVIGGGPLRQRLQRQAEALGLRDAVAWMGARPHGELPLWMNAADALCLTSESEGMPNVVCEALACGTPAVVTDVGECGRLVARQPWSRCVPSSDIEGFVEALLSLLAAGPSEAERASWFSRSWHDQAKELLDIAQPVAEDRERNHGNGQ